MSKVKKVADFSFGEVLNFAVSYLAGYAGSLVLSSFFVKKRWYDPGTWSVFSKRTALDSETYGMYEFWLTYGIGLVIMIVVNRLLKRFFSSSEE